MQKGIVFLGLLAAAALIPAAPDRKDEPVKESTAISAEPVVSAEDVVLEVRELGCADAHEADGPAKVLRDTDYSEFEGLDDFASLGITDE